MQAACAGDRAAYEALLADIAGMLRAHARARLARSGFGPEEAEDVVQETLIALHAKRHTWDPERPILPWIQAIARHKTVDAARRLGRARRRADARPVEDLADLLPARTERPDARRDAHALLARLPNRERGVVEALAIEGLSIAATASRVAISEGAVRVAFHRGLARLRRLAGEDGPGERKAAR